MLIDTNIIIEMGRSQKKSQQCRDLLSAIDQELINEEVFITKFSLSAIEAILSQMDNGLIREILLLIFQEKIQIIDMDIKDDIMILATKKDLGLDFDDATQFVAAKRLNTYLVTFDKDFDQIPLKTKTPEQILKKLLAKE